MTRDGSQRHRKKNYAFKKFSITTSTTSDSNRNKNMIQHYNQGKPTDCGIKNVLINSRSNIIRRAVIITKIFRIFDKFLTMHTDGFSCDSILRTRHNVPQNCRTQRSIMYNRPTQQFWKPQPLKRDDTLTKFNIHTTDSTAQPHNPKPKSLAHSQHSYLNIETCLTNTSNSTPPPPNPPVISGTSQNSDQKSRQRRSTTCYTGPAEIPGDLVTHLWVEPLAWGICPWALF
jgi:hypothetical protein